MSIGYFCYVSGFRAPKKLHETLESACEEAKRLASVNIGRDVYVMGEVFHVVINVMDENVNVKKEKRAPVIVIKKKRLLIV